MRKAQVIARLQEIAALLPDPIPPSWPGRHRKEHTIRCTNAAIRRAWNAMRSIASECGISHADLVRNGGEIFQVIEET